MQDPYEILYGPTKRCDGPNWEYINRFESIPEFKALHSLVQPDATATGADALHELSRITLAFISSDESKTKFLGNHIYYTMEVILELAARTAPMQQTKLVNFVIQLQRHAVTDPNTGEALRFHLYDNDLVWTE